jgi:hypothetical protein
MLADNDTGSPIGPRLGNGVLPFPGLPAGFLQDDDGPIVRKPELIRDGVPRHGTGILIGQSGAGKTFGAVHLATCLAAGKAFFGRRVNQRAGTVYLAYEGAGNVKRRMRAARLHAGLPPGLPFIYGDRVGDLFNEKHLSETIAALRACGRFLEARYGVEHALTVVDTLSASFGMRDENSNAEVARVCRTLALIAEATGAFTLGIHHMGKDPKAGARGGSAYRGNVDFSLSCLADRDAATGKCSNHRLVIDKSRDGPEGPLGAFELVEVEIGEEDGKPFHSLAVIHTGKAKAAEAASNFRRSELVFKAAFDETLHTDGRSHAVLLNPGIKSPIVTAVPVDAVRREFYRRWITGDSEDTTKAQAARQKAFKRTLETIGGYRHEALSNGDELIWRL